jgi:hypothetical protein
MFQIKIWYKRFTIFKKYKTLQMVVQLGRIRCNRTDSFLQISQRWEEFSGDMYRKKGNCLKVLLFQRFR